MRTEFDILRYALSVLWVFLFLFFFCEGFQEHGVIWIWISQARYTFVIPAIFQIPHSYFMNDFTLQDVEVYVVNMYVVGCIPSHVLITLRLRQLPFSPQTITTSKLPPIILSRTSIALEPLAPY